METLSLGLFTGSFSPDKNKRFRFKAKGASTAVALAQLVYNGASTVFFKTNEGYAEIANNYLTWTFHAPQNFKLSADSDTALDTAYIKANQSLTLSEFFQLLAAATKYDGTGANGVEVAGWESAMRTLQLAENRINQTLSNFSEAAVRTISGTEFGTLTNFGTFSAPMGTANLFAQFVEWIDETLRAKEKKSYISSTPAWKCINGGTLTLVLVFNDYVQVKFTFADHVE